MIRGVLFDMDGVLLDTERLGRQIYLRVCAEVGYPQVDEALYSRLIGRPYEDDRLIMMDVLGPDFPYDEVSARHIERLTALVLSGRDVTKPGLGECLRALKAKGMRLALATSTQRPTVEQYLRHIAPMRDVFDAVVCGVEAGRGKPAPDIYLEAARRLELPPEDCVGVEDSLAGLQSLTAAGCVRVMIPDLLPRDKRFAGLVDYELPDLTRLPALIDRLRLGARVRG